MEGAPTRIGRFPVDSFPADTEAEWMWGDAGTKLTRGLAEKNPLRWTTASLRVREDGGKDDDQGRAGLAAALHREAAAVDYGIVSHLRQPSEFPFALVS